MNKLALFVSLLLYICVSYAQIYKWTDSQGNVHFSDTPHDGAEEIKLAPSQTFSPPPKPKVRTVEEPSQDDKGRTYSIVEITQPENEATIRNNQGYVVVAVQMKPDLIPGDNVQMLFDGKALGEPQQILSFELNGIDRGAHTVAVQVLNANGDILGTSDVITFYMHRPRVGMGGG